MLLQRRRTALEILWRIFSAPPVTISLGGGPDAEAIFRDYTGRHPKLPLFGRKTIGVALLDLTDKSKLALMGNGFKVMRRHRRKALANGFAIRQFDPASSIAQIMEINASTPVRQGRRIAEHYLDVGEVQQTARDNPLSFGAFDADGVLRAYAHTPIVGDLCIFSQILGHADYMESGLMYLLVSEINREMAKTMKASGSPRWAFYDTYLGATEGLRFFKDKCGFEPRRVKWVRTEDRTK